MWTGLTAEQLNKQENGSLVFVFFGLCNQITKKLAGLNWESAPRTKTRQIRIDLNGESCKVTSVMSKNKNTGLEVSLIQ